MKKQFLSWITLLFMVTQVICVTAAPADRITNEFHVLVDSCPLPPPASLSIDGATSSTISISWAAVPGAVRYNVKAFEFNTSNLVADFDVNAPQVNAVITGLTSLTNYRIEVSASACLIGLTGHPVTGFGATTGIVITDIVLQYPTGNECVPVPAAGTPSSSICIENGLNMYDEYTVYTGQFMDVAETPAWTCGFGIFAPCPEYIVLDIRESLTSGIQPVLNVTSDGRVIVRAEGYGSLFQVSHIANGNLSGCLNTNKTAFLITPLMDNNLFRYRHNNLENICSVSFPGAPACSRGNNQSIVIQSNGGIKTESAQARRVSETANLLVLPNPVEQNATVQFVVPEASPVTIALYNTMGRVVRMLEQSDRSAGTYEHELYTEDLPAGLYYLVMQTASDRQIVTVVKHN